MKFILSRIVIFFSLFSTWIQHVRTGRSPCPNGCNEHGSCTKWNTCECFDGYEGNDCSLKSCPVGPSLAALPYDLDTAHKVTECSGRGTCDYKNGLCICQSGYFGFNCAKSKCANDCSNHGKCISLRTAALEEDGYRLNRTTVYNRWDADIIFGCVCDYGWSGSDCSQRLCEYGTDPRLGESSRETVILGCQCEKYGCSGKFKLRMYGVPIKQWLQPSSTASQLVAAIMTAPNMYRNSEIYAFPTINTTSPNQPICRPGVYTETKIQFRRNTGNLPALSFYANLIETGQLFFKVSCKNLVAVLKFVFVSYFVG
jgi:hypothetical protein